MVQSPIIIKVNPNINTIQRHSKFTKQNLLDLNNPLKSFQSPLSTIAHIDVNAFFAQVEQIRTGLSPEDPIVCVQWSTLIAVSYPAREYGIGRMDSIETAKLKCPVLKPIHTAVFKKGENFWRYTDEAKEFPSPVNHKVSLDPYRRESRKLMKMFKLHCDLVEKASVDESFLELGRLVLRKLFEIIPDFKIDRLKNDDYLPNLPIDLSLTTYGYMPDTEVSINDYDDLFILLGSIITHDIRKDIQENLGYTTSCGISNNKTLAKLASGFKKPNNQTIVLNSQIFQFLNNFQLKDFWSMGGKTGEFLKMKLIPEDDESNSIEYIRNHYTINELKILLNDDSLSLKLFEMCKGSYKTPVVSKIQLKSMNSSKNVRGKSCENIGDSIQWIRIFAVDLYQRLIEIEDELSKKIRPKTISMSVRLKDFTSHSKQISIQNIYCNNDEMEEIFYNHGIQLIKELEIQYGKIYPLTNLNMTINNFELLDKGFENNNILNFAKKGDINDVFKDLKKEPKTDQLMLPVPKKKVQNNAFKSFEKVQNINDLFKDLKQETSQEIITKNEPLPSSNAQYDAFKKYSKVQNINDVFLTPKKEIEEVKAVSQVNEGNTNNSTEVSSIIDDSFFQITDLSIICQKCNIKVVDIDEHKDFHYALELSKTFDQGEQRIFDNKDNNNNNNNNNNENTISKQTSRQNTNGNNNSKKKSVGNKRTKFDKNQSKLPF
ncbi:hypothetical protein WICMUC_003361 [Wickerhamomyces mucosus]|uniref:DNA polymerase eta n=1 Tax=Wickerhamomyces mucosus TaxID=1378264 RepID=A0A9P8PMP4_9ASCO|nr:hypothetical protein WICMUC_003361 [Wickerhamomyces mucosus]